jgi:hypothetical protein
VLTARRYSAAVMRRSTLPDTKLFSFSDSNFSVWTLRGADAAWELGPCCAHSLVKAQLDVDSSPLVPRVVREQAVLGEKGR